MREIDQELFDAVKQGNLDSVRGCLSKCADVSGTDGDGKTPLHYAAQKGKLEVIPIPITRQTDGQRWKKSHNEVSKIVEV